jgi:ATP-dependent protease ClpP protease subunit
MKKLFLTLLLVASTSLAGTITKFTMRSTTGVFAIKEPFTESLKSRFIEKITTDRSDTMYIYIDSPGGSVFALQSMIEQMLFSDKYFVCIARFAASAAFMLYQYCDERYMLPYGSMLMSHNASATLSGTIPELRSMLDAWERLILKLEVDMAVRLGMTYAAYKHLISKDTYMDFTLAKRYNATDSKAIVVCTPELVNTKVKISRESCSFFGCAEEEEIVSGCPIIDKKFPSKKKKED